MHTLFVLEDRYGLKICEVDGEMCLRLERKNNLEFHNMFSLLETWAKKAKELKLGKITKEEYGHWRYHYPDLETFGFTRISQPELILKKRKIFRYQLCLDNKKWLN